MTAPPDLLYIDGQWTTGHGPAVEVTDPSDETVIATIAAATSQDVERALEAAQRGFESWRATDVWTRSAALRRVAEVIRERAEELAAVMTQEQGKPLAESVGEIKASADQFDWFADEARRIYGRTIDGHSRDVRLYALRQPVGPVAAITAWNFPALLPARKMAAAMAAGCSITVKPAREAPRTALGLAQACHEAGIPAGVVNVVIGDAAAITDQLISSPVIRKVSLTGSVPVGKEVLRRCAERIVPATLELGGHAPVLVFADADLDRAARLCVTAKFRNSGQVCISPSRFYVQEPAVAEFTERVAALASALRVGPGTDPGTDVGPLTSERRRSATEALVADAVGKGATVAAGGRRPEGFDAGYFYEPTVLTGASQDMDVMRVEPFGPILPIAPFADAAEGVRMANSTSFGLAGYLFTERTATAVTVAEELEVGMVGINNMVIATAEAPFGGIKESGFGREGGVEGMDPYLVTKYVNLAL